MRPLLALVMCAGLATLHELDTVYSLEDVMDMAEVIQVQRYNEWLASRRDEKGAR